MGWFITRLYKKLTWLLMLINIHLDVNECTGDHGCHHSCNNTNGSFHCYCNPGYMLHSNGINCTG